MYVDCRVHPIVKEFIVATTGSDVIVARKNEWLHILLYPILKKTPITYVPNKHRDDLIRLQLAWYTVPALKRIDCYNYLDEEGQRVVARYLKSWFKVHFHSFCSGYLSCDISRQQKEAIEVFCETYNLPLNNINYEMLKKSWDRSVEKCKLYR